MQDIPLLAVRSMHVSKRLHPVHRVHMDISLERLAARLNLFCTTPHAVFAALGHLAVKALFCIVDRRWRDWARGRGGP